MQDSEFKIQLKVHNPRQLKLVLDYEHYHFKFDQFLKVIIENDYKEIEANVDTLIKETNNLEEVTQYHEWKKNGMKDSLQFIFADENSVKI